MAGLRGAHKTPMTDRDPTVTNTNTVFNGIRFDLERVEVSVPRLSGHGLRQSTYDVVRVNHTVSVLPYDPNLDHFIFVKQFRIGAFLRDHTGFSLEIPGGIVDAGDDDIASAATRELGEETGLTATSLTKIQSYYPANWMSDQKSYVFLARVDSKNIDQYGGLAEENEDLEIITMPRPQARQALSNGDFIHGGTIMALTQFFMSNSVDE
jgi:ADP-ribose pyrophosphatase